jgi:hypothetical protein
MRFFYAIIMDPPPGPLVVNASEYETVDEPRPELETEPEPQPVAPFDIEDPIKLAQDVQDEKDEEHVDRRSYHEMYTDWFCIGVGIVIALGFGLSCVFILVTAAIQLGTLYVLALVVILWSTVVCLIVFYWKYWLNHNKGDNLSYCEVAASVTAQLVYCACVAVNFAGYLFIIITISHGDYGSSFHISSGGAVATMFLLMNAGALFVMTPVMFCPQ